MAATGRRAGAVGRAVATVFAVASVACSRLPAPVPIPNTGVVGTASMVTPARGGQNPSTGVGATAAGPGGEPTGGLSGELRVLLRPGADTTLGPVVVTAEPVLDGAHEDRTPERVLVRSTSDRFDPPLTVVATGDSLVFVNDGSLSHRLFSADLGADLRIPVRPSASSTPFVVEHRGSVRFFCSLHPDESFDVLVTPAAASDRLDDNGWYDIWPLADGRYRLSIWSRRVSGPVRIVEVSAGRLSIEPIWIDAGLLGR